ncbi:hypothetical protein [Oerskovia flava]|uniref:hypothetical protein n=1 Tax=Oerskovia flava TaxID=2986422 RepID=UPI00223FDB9F|nr:hypothetical protein [Oerskovia sp. JB1-3-2]
MPIGVPTALVDELPEGDGAGGGGGTGGCALLAVGRVAVPVTVSGRGAVTFGRMVGGTLLSLLI